MDHSHTCQLQPSEPLPHQQQHQQQLRHHDSSCSSPSQPDHDPHLDATPQDVLAEARKNLQVLIDSGLSRDLLHQWVDDSQSLQLQLSFPLASQPFASPQAQPQAPPPPLSRAPSGSGSASARSTPTVAVSGPPSSASTPTLPSTSIKPEALADDTPQTWPPPRLASNSATASSSPERRTASIKDADATMLIAPSAPFSHSHSPRISISSVSSGYSGHASIWSSNSAQSSFSWHSGTTGGRSMAPLPVPPSATSMLVVNGNSSASHHNRQNVYWCTSCETSFKRKYDWKRHEDEFHERWRKYPCPEPGCNRSFWGSNSFNQHHKQCHGCKTCPHAEKVVKFLRKRKYWACGFCSALYPARERHVEHVARHFESGMTKGDWMHSRVIYGLLHQPLIHEAWDTMVATKQPEYAGRRPQFSWHPSKTGRTQGFLEKESAGQLQDLLEFFSGDEGEAQWIVTSAYDLADIVLVNSTGLESPPFSASTSTSMAPPQAYPSQDAQASFAAVSAQPPHQPILPSSPNSQCSYTPSFRNTMFFPSQHFTSPPGPSSESSSHSQSPLTASQSPLTAAHSPLALSHSSLEHRELPQLPPTTCGPTSADSIMDFEYSPTPILFEDWESLSGAMIHEATPVPGPQGGWGMVQYFGLPPVTS